MRTVQEILHNILLQNDDNWKIVSVDCNDDTEEIHLELRYCQPDIVFDGVHYSIYDHRPLREWRHLDLWQYKTYLSARVPRYKKDGKAVSVEVPWALPDARLTWLLEKKR